MDNKIHQDELEQFLQEEVKQHRMYPSDHIWRNIRTELHGNKAWPALTFISLFIITALTISTLLNNHPVQLVSRSSITALPKPAQPAQNLSMTVADKAVDKNYFEKIAPEQITAETFAGLKENNVIADQGIIAVNTFDNVQPIGTQMPADHLRLTEKTNTHAPVSSLQQQLTIAPSFIAKEEAPVANTLMPTTEPPAMNVQPAQQTTAKATDAHATPDDFFKDFRFVGNTEPQKKNSKFGFQFYVTPSTSYRRLSDDKVKEIIQPAAAAVSGNQTLSLNYSAYTSDVNSVVRHRPAVGMEMGFAVLYNMSSRLKLKTGVQLNIRQYHIETFQSLTNDLTSLSLINYRGVETVNFYSQYNNNTGYRKTELDNKVYQVSVPIGIQWEVIQGRHFGITTEASVQPTMTLNNNTYLLSTDYKHYTDGNEFIRKWNINTSLGLNLSYKVGSTSWQIGPQIRYQHLPTYSNIYPIKEYLLDYGVRLGFTKQIR
jgi:hypothetical protein